MGRGACSPLPAPSSPATRFLNGQPPLPYLPISLGKLTARQIERSWHIGAVPPFRPPPRPPFPSILPVLEGWWSFHAGVLSRQVPSIGTSRDQNPLSPFQKRKEDTGGWFVGWQITSASPMRGRHYDAIFRSQVLAREREAKIDPGAEPPLQSLLQPSRYSSTAVSPMTFHRSSWGRGLSISLRSLTGSETESV